jgi:hydrogenase expression/formation protein HypE
MRSAVIRSLIMPFECPVPKQVYEQITLAHGGGGKMTHRLISQLLLPLLQNDYLLEMHDGAVIPIGNTKLAFTTDSFVVNPIFFPGGNIGHLAVHGTVNDLAMCGARPLFLSLAFILEEGFPMDSLREIVASVHEASSALRTEIVTGDIKVVERGKGDGIYVNTTGIGDVMAGIRISPERIRPGDQIILSGPLAEHGIAILSKREGLSFETELKSDTAGLWPAVELLLKAGGEGVHALRDATRGGLASALNELAQSASVGMVIEEESICVREEVRGACEILGLDPLYVANEGKFVAMVAPEVCEDALRELQQHPLGIEACVIGEVVNEHEGLVRLKTPLGASRVVEMMSGEQLPRIC